MLLIFLLGVLGNALIGGVLPAAVAAVIAGLLANFLFTPPFGSFTITATRERFRAWWFSSSSGSRSHPWSTAARCAPGRPPGVGPRRNSSRPRPPACSTRTDPVHAVLEQARVGFGMRSVLLLSTAGSDGRRTGGLRRRPRCPGRRRTASVNPDAADVAVPAGPAEAGWTLALYGRPLPPADLRLVQVFAAQAVLAVDRERMTRQAAQGERLRQTDSVRTAVLAALSHDLRTPLATIKASVSSLRDRSITWTEADQTELLAATDNAADQLDALLENLLDLSRLQTGAVVPLRRPVSVDEVVHRALIGIPGDRVTDAIPDDLPLIDTDAGLLERVIANIIFNAVRYTPAGPSVSGCWPARSPTNAAGTCRSGSSTTAPACRSPSGTPCSRRSNDSVTPAGRRCRSGPGRCPRAGRCGRRHHRGRRHPRWWTDHDRHRAHRREQHSREHRSRNTPYRGRVRDRGQRMTGVLVVDDDRPLTRALAINLRAHGYEVTLAHDGRSALAEVTRVHPAVVILDLGLPDLDGIEVLAGIRGWSAVPVIVLSARSTSAEKVEALDAGADDYVTKPFGMDELLARIRASVRRSAAVPAEELEHGHHRGLHRRLRRPPGPPGRHARAADAHRMVVAGDPGAAQRETRSRSNNC